MNRTITAGCAVVFTAFVLACGGTGSNSTPQPEPIKAPAASGGGDNLPRPSDAGPKAVELVKPSGESPGVKSRTLIAAHEAWMERATKDVTRLTDKVKNQNKKIAERELYLAQIEGQGLTDNGAKRGIVDMKVERMGTEALLIDAERLLATGPPPAIAETWTKSHTPDWVGEMPGKWVAFWNSLLQDNEPTYTAVFRGDGVYKISVSRREWKKLNAFQARNHLMFAVVLPHTDETTFEYVDDFTGQNLATFTAKSNANAIHVIHP